MSAFYAFLFALALILTGCTNNYRAPGTDKAGVPTDDSGLVNDSGTPADDSGTPPDDSGSDTDTDSGTPSDDCTDGVDNDGDGYIDAEDPGCENGDGLETPFDEPVDTGTGDTGDSGDDTGTPEESAEDCFNDMPFRLQFHAVDYNRCTDLGLSFTECFGATDWDELKFVDTENVGQVNGFSGTLVNIYHPDTGAFEGQVYLPTDTSWYGGATAYNQEYNNGVIVALQPDGTLVEISYYSYSGGIHRGHLLPDDDANRQDACTGIGYDTVNWIGGHGGTHITGSQAWRECEIIGTCDMNRPLPFEGDRTHYRFDSTDPYCSAGFTGWAASADDYAASAYSGTMEGQCIGGFFQIVPAWDDADEDGEVDTDPSWDGISEINGELTYYDCTSNMQTIPSYQFCMAASRKFIFSVDDSGGEDEIAIPIAVEVESDGSYNDVIANVIAATGVDLVNSRYYNNPDGNDGAYECDGDEGETEAYAEDIALIFSLIEVVPPELVVEMP